MFSPSSPEDDTAHALTLVDIHTQVTNILPSKWVDQADVYNMLKELDYKIFQEKYEWEHENDEGKKEKRVSYSLKYFVKIAS
tara:strand:+ start:11657 stop:11902 length:246 start_codon:yes stop_codon:yes gene_type:complete